VAIATLPGLIPGRLATPSTSASSNTSTTRRSFASTPSGDCASTPVPCAPVLLADRGGRGLGRLVRPGTGLRGVYGTTKLQELQDEPMFLYRPDVGHGQRSRGVTGGGVGAPARHVPRDADGRGVAEAHLSGQAVDRAAGTLHGRMGRHERSRAGWPPDQGSLHQASAGWSVSERSNQVGQTAGSNPLS